MMFKLSLISLFLLFVGYTVGDATTISSMTVANTTMDLNSKATMDSKTMPNHQTTLIPTMNPNSKTTSHSNPKKTVKTAVTSKTATSVNTTTMKNDGNTLNPQDNVHFLFSVIFLLFCVH